MFPLYVSSAVAALKVQPLEQLFSSGEVTAAQASEHWPLLSTQPFVAMQFDERSCCDVTSAQFGTAETAAAERAHVSTSVQLSELALQSAPAPGQGSARMS